MELQHTHTFRVTMTRSHRKGSGYAHTSISIKTNNTFDTNIAVSAELNTERDASMQLRKQTSFNTSNNRSDDIKCPAAKLMQHTH